VTYFRHNQDNLIIITGTVFPMEFWLSVYEHYAVEAPFTSQYYEPGVRHTVSLGDFSEQRPIPWTEGDGYIAALPELITAYEVWEAENNPEPLPTERELRAVAAIAEIADIDFADQAAKIRASGAPLALRRVLLRLLRNEQKLAQAAQLSDEADIDPND
jgi:hypothetical protein